MPRSPSVGKGAASPGGGALAAVGSTAAAKIVVMGLSGVLGILTSRMIISHFGTEAYQQYGLLTTITNLLPFADLGIAAVVINAIAASPDARHDLAVRRTITTAMRILLGSGLVIGLIAVTITVLGGWPALLGNGLLPGSGPVASMLCFIAFGLALPLTVGQRILVGLRRTGTQVASQSVVAPFMFASILLLTALAVPAGGYIAVLSYVGNGLISVICLVISARLLAGQLRAAVRDVPRLRAVPGVPVMATAWPMLAQMLVQPIALQTDRLLLSHLTVGDQLARYNLASQLFGLVLVTISTAGVALWPIYARARAGSRIESPLRPSVYFAVGGFGVAALLAVLSPWVVDFVADGKIHLDGWLIWGFVAYATLQAAKYPAGMYMTDPAGLRFQVLPSVVLVPVNLGLSWYLIGVLGPGGTVIGSAVSVLVCQVLPNLWYVRRDLRRRAAAAVTSPVTTGPAQAQGRTQGRSEPELEAEAQARAEAELEAETGSTTVTPFDPRA